MRIAYFARINLGQSSGVLKKIARQIKYWESQRNEVRLFALSTPFESSSHLFDNISVSPFTTKNYLDHFAKAVHADPPLRNGTLIFCLSDIAAIIP